LLLGSQRHFMTVHQKERPLCCGAVLFSRKNGPYTFELDMFCKPKAMEGTKPRQRRHRSEPMIASRGASSEFLVAATRSDAWFSKFPGRPGVDPLVGQPVGAVSCRDGYIGAEEPGVRKAHAAAGTAPGRSRRGRTGSKISVRASGGTPGPLSRMPMVALRPKFPDRFRRKSHANQRLTSISTGKCSH
jgi:hypothetical protein